jgi:3-oxoacyl-[acyl-carrier protein] reductase
MMKQLLENDVAIITGGTAGIGKAIALKFAEHGAKVVVFGTNPNRGREVVNEIHQLTGEDSAVFYAVDVAKAQSVDEAIKKVLETHGRVDILINNAGITRDQLLMKMSEEDWDQVLDTNLKSCYHTCHAIVRPMMKARKGKIINVSSVVALMGNPGQVNYAASKAGMIGFTKALAKEIAARGICVNCIAPGFVISGMTDVLTQEQKDAVLSKIPMGRMGEAIEIANTALFLASPLASYMTGQVLTVDGGMV